MTHRPRTRVALLVAASVLLLAGCSQSPPPPTITGEAGDYDVGRSITYTTVDDEPLALDACIPSNRSAGPFAAVALIHGGAFEEGNRSSMLDLCKQLAAAGLAAFSIDYRLLPASYPAQVDDAVSAIEWLRQPEQIDRFDIDPSRLSLLGSSAGGIIALSTAEQLKVDGAPAASVVALSAAGDLTADALALGTPSEDLQTVVLGYLGCSDIEACPVSEAASPRFGAADLPPTLLFQGSEEIIPIEQGDALVTAIQDAGGSVTLTVVDGARHGVSLLDAGRTAAVVDFLENPGTTP